MEIKRTTLETCHMATGTVIVIDVVRAFTAAAFALAAGARDILLVGTAQEALAWRARIPEALVMGEVDGVPAEGFDLGNSPAALAGLDLNGRRLIQRTSWGTQGVVRSRQADRLLASSLVCASATADYVQRLGLARVTFVLTGVAPDHDGDDDDACADYITALLHGEKPDVGPFVQRVRDSVARRLPNYPTRPAHFEADLEHCVDVDRFDFAMGVKRQEGVYIMSTQHPGHNQRFEV